MAERTLKVTIVGEDKGASKALNGVRKAGDDLTPSVEKTRKALDSVTSALSSHLPVGGDKAKSAMDKVSNSLVGGAEGAGKFGAAAVAGFAVAGAAIAAFAIDGVRQFLRVADEVDGLQDVMGGTAEAASKVRNIGHALGVETDALGASFFKLSQNIEAGKLDAWGVKVAHAKDGSVDLFGTLLNLSDAYVAIEDPQKRNVFLMETFGKAGKTLIDVLEQGSDKLKKFAQSGVIFSDKDLAQAKEFGIATRELGAEADKLKINLSKGVVPALTMMAKGVTSTVETVDKASKGIGGFAGLVDSAINTVLGSAPRVIQAVTSAFGDSGDAAQAEKAQIALLSEALADNVGITDKNALAQVRGAKSIKDAEAAANSAAKAYYAMVAAQERLISTTLGLENAQDRVADAHEDVRRATDDLNEAIREHGRNSKQATDAAEKLSDAQRGLKGDTVALAQQMRDQRVTQIEATGATVDAAQKADLFKQALQQLASTVQEPLRSELLALAGDIRSLPPEKRIDIKVSTAEARAEIQAFLIDTQNEMIRAGLANVNTAAYKAAEGYGGGGGSAESPSGGASYHEGNLDQYDLGGWVKGAKGQPKLAIVHGGEYVISNDEIDRGRSYSGGTSWTGGSTGPASAQPMVIQLVIDGRVLAETQRTLRIRDGLIGVTG